MALNFMANDVSAQPKEIGFYTPLATETPELSAGDVGYILTGIKDPRAIQVGDTVTSKQTQLMHRSQGINKLSQWCMLELSA
ncbi:Elongation factor 4 [Weissella viridescens]|uniref:Elongation factor 4 n=1 Tax=Weissella viridescens TaxID=1629 RepID=A0A380P1W8_WEIVI|nr:Elongation factor 4 [Weissella viridescens]